MVVLDSSAVIAIFNKEPGAEFIAEQLSDAFISAVNVQEIAKKMLERGFEADEIREAIGSLGIHVLVHDTDDAFLAASLAAATRKFGRGLGDRSCIALAIRLGAPVLTTDRNWAKLDIPGLQVILAR